MKREYELTYIVRILPTDDEVNQVIDQVVEWIEHDDNGKVNKIDRTMFGRRKLAYEIDKQREGHYVLKYAEIDVGHLPELELNLKLNSDILRYLFVRVDE